jgi:DNA-binding NarL/FixJ family response regulator
MPLHHPFRTPAVPAPTSLLQASPAVGRRLRLTAEEPRRAPITPRQMDVLYCLVEGKSTKRICRELKISEGTAKVHIAALFRALEVHNRTEATLAALRDGWIQPEMWSRG